MRPTDATACWGPPAGGCSNGTVQEGPEEARPSRSRHTPPLRGRPVALGSARECIPQPCVTPTAPAALAPWLMPGGRGQLGQVQVAKNAPDDAALDEVRQQVRAILEHLGLPTAGASLVPARGPPRPRGVEAQAARAKSSPLCSSRRLLGERTPSAYLRASRMPALRAPSPGWARSLVLGRCSETRHPAPRQ